MKSDDTQDSLYELKFKTIDDKLDVIHAQIKDLDTHLRNGLTARISQHDVAHEKHSSNIGVLWWVVGITSAGLIGLAFEVLSETFRR